MLVLSKFITLNHFVYKNYYTKITMKGLHCIFMYTLDCKLLKSYKTTITHMHLYLVCVLKSYHAMLHVI